MASIHEDIVNYFRQQRQMYGDVLYTEGWKASRIVIPSSDSPLPIPHSPTTVQAPASPSSAWTEAGSLEVLNSEICTCMNCPLGSTRTNFVFGSGNPQAEVMVIGEAPGADEDAQGLPFVGRAGQLLTKILEAIQLTREDVYICNILKCRPPNNRKPLQSETDSCEPYLWKQIDLVKPRYILALGLTAANTLLKNKTSMKDLRGTLHDYHGIPTLVTYHPAALLRNPAWKKETWEDVQKLRELLNNRIAE
jgi:uracil-DNA glycosylase